jgi:hypothetical protein
MKQLCLLSVSLICCGVNCLAQTNGSNVEPKSVAPAMVQGPLLAAMPGRANMPPHFARKLPEAADSWERFAAFAYFEHAAAPANLFADGQGGNGVAGKAGGPASAQQGAGETKLREDSSRQTSSPPRGEQLLPSSEASGQTPGATPQADGASPLTDRSLSVNQLTTDLDGKHLAEFQQFDAYWKPAPPTQSAFQHAVHGIFWIDPIWTDPNARISTTGFDGSQLWQRTFDPRTTIWPTPRIAEP